jgi:hypothetical protein
LCVVRIQVMEDVGGREEVAEYRLVYAATIEEVSGINLELIVTSDNGEIVVYSGDWEIEKEQVIHDVMFAAQPPYSYDSNTDEAVKNVTATLFNRSSTCSRYCNRVAGLKAGIDVVLATNVTVFHM